MTASKFYVLNMLQNVVDAISSASFAMQELAKEQEHIDKHTLHKAVEYFLDQIEVSVGVTQLSQAAAAVAAVLDSSANLVGQAGDDSPWAAVHLLAAAGGAEACAGRHPVCCPRQGL